MRRIALIAALGLAAAAPVALARAPAPAKPAAAPSAKPGQAATPLFANSNEPIDISSDNSEQFREERRYVWYGNVEVIQGTSRLRTPRLTVFYTARDPSLPKPAPGDPTADVGKIERVEAEGPVFYVTPTQKAKGDHGTYIGADDTITLTGNVVLVQDRNVATGEKLVIEQKTGHSTLISSVKGGAPKQRVRSVLYNNNTTNAAAPAGAPAPAAAAPKPATPAKPAHP